MGLFDGRKNQKKADELEEKLKALEKEIGISTGSTARSCRDAVTGKLGGGVPDKKDYGKYVEVLEDTYAKLSKTKFGRYNLASKDYIYNFKIAGVTFDNEDGTSRQANLKKLYSNFNKGITEINGESSINFVPYEYKGEKAIGIEICGLEVGNVPANKVEAFTEEILNGEMTRVIPSLDKFKDDDGYTTYYGTLTVHYNLK